MIHPRGDIPIDGAHIVPSLIFAHFFKVHSLAFEDTMVLTRQRIAHQSFGAQFDLANLLEDFARDGSSARHAIREQEVRRKSFARYLRSFCPLLLLRT